MKSEIKTQNISTKKLKFVAEIFLADLRLNIIRKKGIPSLL